MKVEVQETFKLKPMRSDYQQTPTQRLKTRRRLKALRREGHGLDAIVNILNKEGLKTTHGNDWTNSRVANKFSVMKRAKMRKTKKRKPAKKPPVVTVALTKEYFEAPQHRIAIARKSRFALPQSLSGILNDPELNDAQKVRVIKALQIDGGSA